MFDSTDSNSNKARLFVGVLIIAGGIALLIIMASSLDNSSVQARSADPSVGSQSVSIAENPNIITAGMLNTTDQLSEKLSTAERSLSRAGLIVANNTLRAGSFAAINTKTAAVFTVRGTASGASYAARVAGNGLGFIVSIPVHVAGSISNNRAADFLIRPASGNKKPLPVIDSATIQQEKVIALAAQDTREAMPQTQAKWQWPLHGSVTLEFGASDWPYQVSHTGIDISDGRLGITPVAAVSSGTVIQTISSRVGLGNHVLVDHGGGVVSVYGHLAAISVQVGQKVEAGTSLGIEGSTGASTGAHVHLEIRVNGQTVNPRQYIGGQP